MAQADDEVVVEQHVVTRLYERLDTLRDRARDRLTSVRRAGPSGSPQNRSERDAFAILYEDRLAQLDGVEDRLCFGRLDLDDDPTPRYVGRIGLTDEEHTSILTDWRAPAAQSFYRATAARREGVWRRRSIVTRARAVTHLEDDVLDLSRLADSDEHVSGDGALLAALARARTSRMSDIVATIQAEQDVIIRDDLDGALVVQGGPGTGKTAVALHRAAYLLYAHRRRLERSGVLIVGPSGEFLRYIDQVLPSLGETGVVSTTVTSLYPGVTISGSDSPTAARVKGSARMAAAVAQAVRARERVPTAPVRVRIAGHELVITPEDVSEAITRARRTHRPHNEARLTFVSDMLSRLLAQYTAQLSGEASEDLRTGIAEDIRTHREVRVALNLAWFPITPERLISDLMTKPHRLAEAYPGLSPAERDSVARKDPNAWTRGDVPLLDEAAELLGEDRQAERAEQQQDARERERAVQYAEEALAATQGEGNFVDPGLVVDRYNPGHSRRSVVEAAASDRSWTFGHVVVDEAQELSEMEWRMLLRRCPTRSFTIVGDVAQTSSPAGTTDWDARLSPLLGAQLRHARLTVNYRNPDAVATAADSMARAADLPVTTLSSAREVPHSLALEPQPDLTAASQQAADTAIRELTRLEEGRVAVIAPGAVLPQIQDALESVRAAGPLPVDGRERDSTGAERLVVTTPQEAKGLEFDVVVLVAPVEIAATGGRAADLYVAMTRPTRRLVMIGVAPWPDGVG